MKPSIIELPKFLDPRGNLSFLQKHDQFPFEIKRVFWTYDVPGGEKRGGHAYYEQQEIIIALSGSFDIRVIEKDKSEKIFSLNRSYYGLYVPPNTWRQMENFSTNSLSLHISSLAYTESDYIRDFEIYTNHE